LKSVDNNERRVGKDLEGCGYGIVEYRIFSKKVKLSLCLTKQYVIKTYGKWMYRAIFFTSAEV
jgi:hypothetical protein